MRESVMGMRESGISPCPFRHPTLRVDRYQCAHPRVHYEDHIVHPRTCQRCPFANEAAGVVPLDLPDCHPGVPQSQLGLLPRHDGLACRHIGDVLRTEGCTTCQGNVRTKVYGCAAKVSGETRLLDCRSCGLFELRC
mgnify:FL=1